MLPFRRMRILAAAVAGIALLAPAQAQAQAQSIKPFGPPVTITNPTCEFDQAHVQTATDSTGIVHGFADLWGSDCNPSLDITYFVSSTPSNTSWTRHATGLHGFPVAAAVDSTGAYLMYVKYPGLDLRVVKRANDGSISPGRTLSTNVGPDGSLSVGALAAKNGKFWAVWREHVKAGQPGDEFDQTELYEANSFTANTSRSRLTTTAEWDGAPSLAFTNGNAFPLTLVWTRGGSDFGDGGGPTDLRIATRNATGPWQSRSLATNGYFNFWPDVAVTTTATYVTWNRDGYNMLATIKNGKATAKNFNVVGDQTRRPQVAVAPNSLAVSWVTGNDRIVAAEYNGSVWSSRYLTVASSPPQQLNGLSNNKGRVTAVIAGSGTRLYSVTEAS